MSHKLVLDKEAFRKAWLEENLSRPQMCERFHISNGSVQAYVKKFGLHKTKEQKRAAVERTNMQKYGVKNVGQAEKIKEKIQQTFLEKYGETSALKNAEVREKISRTCIEKYGIPTIGSLQEVQQKREATCLEKYGTKCSLASEEGKEKTRATLLEKYGVDNAAKASCVKDKIRETCITKYGHETTLKDETVREKTRKTLMERYGVEKAAQIGYDEFTFKVMNSAEEMRNYIINSSDKTTSGLVKKLNCGSAAFLRRAHYFGLFDLIDRFRSGEEAELFSWVSSLGVECQSAVHNVIDGELDVYIPSHNLAIEFNGNYWHCELQKNKTYHEWKSNLCAEKRIHLIHVYEYEWNDPRMRPIVESIIKGALDIYDRRIFARKCVLAEVSSQEAADFLNDNHLQGARRAKYTIGLFFQGELVQLMSFSHNPHYKCWEIIRSCTKRNTVVVGGLSKLLTYFKNQEHPNAIFSYCDYNKYTGKGYETLGMKFVGMTGPDFKWYLTDGTVVSRNPQKNQELSEIAIAKIWGAGSKKYMMMC